MTIQEFLDIYNTMEFQAILTEFHSTVSILEFNLRMIAFLLLVLVVVGVGNLVRLYK